MKRRHESDNNEHINKKQKQERAIAGEITRLSRLSQPSVNARIPVLSMCESGSLWACDCGNCDQKTILKVSETKGVCLACQKDIEKEVICCPVCGNKDQRYLGYNKEYDLVCTVVNGTNYGECGAVVFPSWTYFVCEFDRCVEYKPVGKKGNYKAKYHLSQILKMFTMDQRPPPDSIIDALYPHVAWEYDKNKDVYNASMTRKELWNAMDKEDELHPEGFWDESLQKFRKMKHLKKKWIHIRYLLTGIKPEPSMSHVISGKVMDVFNMLSVAWAKVKPRNRSIWLRLRNVIREILIACDDWQDTWDEYFPEITNPKKQAMYRQLITQMAEKMGLPTSNAQK